MRQKLDLIPPDLYPTKEPYKPSYSELMAELEADNKRAQIEKEKKRKQREEAKKNQSFGSRLISWFWVLFVPTGFYFFLVDQYLSQRQLFLLILKIFVFHSN